MSEPVRREWYPPLALTAAGFVAVAVVDAVGALISRETGVAYGNFAIVSFAVYCAIGVAVVRRRSLASAAAAAVLVALFDVTIGWWITWQIGPGRIHLPDGSWLPLISAGWFALSLSTGCATAAAAVWDRMRRRRAH